MFGLDLMKQRASYLGYDSQDTRNVKGKLDSFKSALKNSYQAEWITFNDKKYRCLINPDKLTIDYDQKIISIGYEAGMKNGDTFYWDRTNSHWIVYLQHLEEEAYFRASIRQCDYQINGWWCYVRGPVETALVWRQKHQIEFNDMNLSILVYVSQNEETNEFFKRFQKIKFDGHTWRVAATDRYSQPGLIEVYLEEYFDNDMEENVIIPEIVKPDITQVYINGSQEVSAYDTDIEYRVEGASAIGEFKILEVDEDLSTYRIVENYNKVKIKNTDDTSCILDILTGKPAYFILGYVIDNQLPPVAKLDIRIKSL